MTTQDSSSDAEIIIGFCERNGIAVDGEHVLAVTVQKNLSTEFVSAIVDTKSRTLLPNFPTVDLLSTYTERRFGDFIVVFNNKLPHPTPLPAPAVELSGSDGDSAPLCCGAIKVDKNRRLDREQLFVDFVASSGNHPEIIYEVKRQITNGPLLSTKFFKLTNSTLTPITGEFQHKLHAYKNYKCTVHDLYFAVDLYSATARANHHHMRLNPFTKVSSAMLAELKLYGQPKDLDEKEKPVKVNDDVVIKKDDATTADVKSIVL
jgi:hypothetical protein